MKTKALNITDKAVMLSLHFAKLGITRRLGDDQFEVEADKKFVRANKRLLNSAELKRIRRYDSSIRKFVRAQALPSLFKGGFFMVPTALVEKVDKTLSTMAEARALLVDEFTEAYPSLIESAKESLRDIFNENDYIAADEVKDAFAFGWRYINFGVPAQLAQIKQEIYEKEQAKAEKHWEQATAAMQNLLRANMQELVEHIAERLETTAEGKPKVFKASTIENITDFLSTFDARNITDDRDLKALVDKAKKLTKGVDAEKLRDDEQLRAEFKLGMADVKAALDKMVIDKPSRKLRLDEE